MFRQERIRGRRFFEHTRNRFDDTIVRFYAFCDTVSRPLRRDTLRHSLHYFFHQIIRSLKKTIRAVDTKLDTLLRTNKALARKVVKEGTPSGLQEIAAHKAESALSPEEQKKQKERAIGTRL